MAAGNEDAVYPHGLGNFEIVNGVADKKDFGRRKIQCADIFLPVLHLTGRIDIIQSDDVVEERRQTKVVYGLQQGVMLVGG